jgi:voltage-gated potassium channel
MPATRQGPRPGGSRNFSVADRGTPRAWLFTALADRAILGSASSPKEAGMSALRRRVHEILDQSVENDRIARLAGAGLIVLIAANVAAVILESEPWLGAAYLSWFNGFELVSILIFTAEYALRVWSAVENDHGRYHHPTIGRLRYALTPLALVDLIVILPFYLVALIPVDLRFMRVFRLFAVFKLTRYQASMKILAAVLRSEARPIAAAIFILMMLLIIVSSLAYIAESRAQPTAFGSIPDAMYWAITTMTTVGYGDVVPVTPLGKVLAGVVGVIGLGMVALPAGLLASGFSDQLHERRREFEQAVSRILASGTINPQEGDELRGLRQRLGLSDHQAAEIVRWIARREAVCPHCGEMLSADGLTPASGKPRAGRHDHRSRRRHRKPV